MKKPEHASAKDLWDKVSGVAGKIANQHKMLRAWVLNPNLGEGFYQQVHELSEIHSIKRSAEWISRKQLLDGLDESEAEELIECGAIEVRKHPDNPKSYQFKRVTTVESKEGVKTKVKRSLGVMKATDENYQKMVKDFNAFDGLKAKNIKDFSVDKAFGMDGDSSEGEEEGGKKVVPKRSKASALKANGEPDNASEDGGNKPTKITVKDFMELNVADLEEGQVNAYASVVAATIDKLLGTLKNQIVQFKNGMYATPSKVKDYEALVKTATAFSEKLRDKKGKKKALGEARPFMDQLDQGMKELKRVNKVSTASTVCA